MQDKVIPGKRRRSIVFCLIVGRGSGIVGGLSACSDVKRCVSRGDNYVADKVCGPRHLRRVWC